MRKVLPLRGPGVQVTVPIPLTAFASDAAPIAIYWFPASSPNVPVGGASAPISAPPLLLVHGFAQNRYTFHHPDRSLAAHLAAGGRDVFVVELRGHGRSREMGAPRPRGLREYLDLDLPAAAAEVRARTGAPRLTLVGHSLGGLLSQLYAATHPDEISGVCALSTPSHRLGSSRLFRSKAIRSITRVALRLRDRGLSEVLLRAMPSFPLDHLGVVGFATEEHLWGRLPARLRRGRRNPMMFIRPWRKGSFEPAMERDRYRKGFDRTGPGVVLDLLEWGTSGRIPGGNGEQNLVDRLSGLSAPTLLISSPDDETIRARFTTHPEDLPDAAVTAREIPGFGHCDLLLGIDAPAQVWPIIDDWLASL